jgi:hypothetical protein
LINGERNRERETKPYQNVSFPTKKPERIEQLGGGVVAFSGAMAVWTLEKRIQGGFESPL